METMKIIAELETLLAETKKDFIEYSEQNGYPADSYMNFEPEGEAENQAWETGYHRGIEVALNTIKLIT